MMMIFCKKYLVFVTSKYDSDNQLLSQISKQSMCITPLQQQLGYLHVRMFLLELKEHMGFRNFDTKFNGLVVVCVHRNILM